MDTSKFKVRLPRGTKIQCDALPLNYESPLTLNIGLVLDVPELRYFDGVTKGGVPIPLPLEVWNALLTQHKIP